MQLSFGADQSSPFRILLLGAAVFRRALVAAVNVDALPGAAGNLKLGVKAQKKMRLKLQRRCGTGFAKPYYTKRSAPFPKQETL